MATPKQIAAARANGAKSRGPVSAQGKKNSSRNNLRHGAFARTFHLEGALQQWFQHLLLTYRAECRPKTEAEAVLVHQLVIARVQQRRLAAAQAEIWNREFARQQALAPEESFEFLNASTFRALNDKIRASCVLHSIEMRYTRQYFRASTQLEEIQRHRMLKTEYEPNKPLIPKDRSETPQNLLTSTNVSSSSFRVTF